jgi:hypothetical protein
MIEGSVASIVRTRETPETVASHFSFDGRFAANSSRSRPPKFTLGMTGLKAQQTSLDVVSVASDLQRRPSTIRDANQHEKLIERLQVKESKWRHRP